MTLSRKTLSDVLQPKNRDSNSNSNSNNNKLRPPPPPPPPRLPRSLQPLNLPIPLAPTKPQSSHQPSNQYLVGPWQMQHACSSSQLKKVTLSLSANSLSSTSLTLIFCHVQCHPSPNPRRFSWASY